ncbi:MAG: DUF2922 family protein [Cellulosilyticaceae bacterium]
MEIIKRKLVLTFGTPLKTELDLTVNNPHVSLQPAAIKAAMEAVIASGAMGDVVAPSTVAGAKYVIQQVDAVDLA